MTLIKNFRKTRRDRKVIDESMTAAEMVSLGWTPEKVTELSWETGGQKVVYKCEYGLLATVISNRKAVAVVRRNDSSDFNSSLVILDINGNEKFKIENELRVNKKLEKGLFSWFEPSKSKHIDYFGIVFQLENKDLLVQVDVDASKGNVIAVYEYR